MEADLAFLIDALSTPNTPLTRPYSAEQLQEIRDSFVSLQRLLRHNPLPVEEEPESSLRMPRSKAGGSLAVAREALEESPESSGRERKETVSEIIRGSDTFSIWSLDTDTYETRRSLSSDVIVTRRQTCTSTVSYSTPVELVWSNSGYNSESTDSDTTITPDGHRYSLRK
ncbi:uncharacterized protein LOC108162636 [Drosophila miranda]|uniref:uncharacterized protein LOC108162636 n=1 Tax=Drosophila miranda TaxID=7229 RepID=UPI00143F66F0|nr:uncharacterized protein LOC108162636 [Drosophila miranda]